jgi:hypothetical protein
MIPVSRAELCDQITGLPSLFSASLTDPVHFDGVVRHSLTSRHNRPHWDCNFQDEKRYIEAKSAAMAGVYFNDSSLPRYRQKSLVSKRRPRAPAFEESKPQCFT